MKRCARCASSKPESEFSKSISEASGLRTYCKLCERERAREYRKEKAQKRAMRETPRSPAKRDPSVEPQLYVPPAREVRLLPPRATVLAIGDLHFPFHHAEALKQTIAIAKETQPDYIVQVGDLYDLFAFSRYPRSYNVMTPDEEIERGRVAAEFMWSECRRVAPAARRFQLWGNHPDRAHKRVLENLPSAERFVMRGMRDLMAFDGVSTVDCSAHELVLDGVVYLHGFLSKVGDHAARLNRSCVTGHLHVGGVVCTGYEDRVYWELGCGWLGDRASPVFSYNSLKRAHRTTLGVGLVDAYGPRFIPFGDS